MNSIILDASTVLLVIDEFRGKEVQTIFQQIQNGDVIASAPTFLLVEVTNILLKKKKIPSSDVKQFIHMLRVSNIQFVDFLEDQIDTLLETAIQHGITAYDAFYVILARELKHPLITEDQELLQITGLGMNVEKYLQSL